MVKKLNQSGQFRIKLSEPVKTIGAIALHKEKINMKLKSLGAVMYDMALPETHSLPPIIPLDEEIKGIVFGRFKYEHDKITGRGALVATDHRIYLIDRKPLFLNVREISYLVVSGVSFAKVGPAGTVVLNTRLGDINIRTFNASMYSEHPNG